MYEHLACGDILPASLSISEPSKIAPPLGLNLEISPYIHFRSTCLDMSRSEKKLTLLHRPLDGMEQYMMWFQEESPLLSVGSYGVSTLTYAKQRQDEWIGLSNG